MRLVGSATIPAGAVIDTMELASDKSFEARGIRQTMHHPKIGEIRLPHGHRWYRSGPQQHLFMAPPCALLA